MNKYHKIISEPHHKYKIIDFRYYCDTSFSIDEYFIDLKLKKDDEIRNLRFIAPRNFEVKEGFPHIGVYLAIFDIKDRGLEGINLEITGEEQDGCLNFYAKNVIDLDNE